MVNSISLQSLGGINLKMMPAWKELSNGLRYIVSEQTHPKGFVSIELTMNAGSFYEADHEAGLVHFIEHMAFQRSENLREFLAPYGVKLGEGVNAKTDYEKTIYNLYELPAQDPELLRKSLQILHKMIFCMKFPVDKVELEKSIILREVHKRLPLITSVNNIDALYPGCHFSKKLPDGDIEVIEKTTPYQLEELYKKLYRADRTSLVIIGDINCSTVEKDIEEIFGKVSSSTDPFPLNLPFPTHNYPDRHTLVKKSQQSTPIFYVTYKQPLDKSNEQKIIGKIATDIIKKRISSLRDEHAEIKKIYYSSDEVLNTKLKTISFTLLEDVSLKIFQAYLIEMRALELNGITDEEFSSSKEKVLASSLHALAELKAKQINHSTFFKRFRSHGRIAHPDKQSLLEQVSSFMNKVTINDVFEAMKPYFPSTSRVNYKFHTEDPFLIRKELSNSYEIFSKASPTRSISTLPSFLIETPKQDILDFIEHGHCCEILLSEQSRLFFYPRQGNKESISLVAVGPGMDHFSLTKKEKISLILISHCLCKAAFPGFTPTDMQNLMNCSAFDLPEIYIYPSYHYMQGEIESCSAELLFKLFHWFLSDSNILNDNCKKQFELEKIRAKQEAESYKPQNIQQNKFDAVLCEMLLLEKGMTSSEIEENIPDGDTLTFEDAVKIFNRYRASLLSSYNFILMGNLNKEEVISLASRFLANLPLKKADIPLSPSVSTYNFPQPINKSVVVKCLGDKDDSQIAFSFPFTCSINLKDEVLFSLAQEVVRRILEEELCHQRGMIYGMNLEVVSCSSTREYEYGYLRFHTSTSQEKSLELQYVFLKIIKNLLQEDGLLTKFLNVEVQAKSKRVQALIQTDQGLLQILREYFSLNAFQNPYDYQNILDSITLEDLKDKIRVLFVENTGVLSVRSTLKYCKTRTQTYQKHESFMRQHFEPIWVLSSSLNTLFKAQCHPSKRKSIREKVLNQLSQIRTFLIENRINSIEDKFNSLLKEKPDSFNPSPIIQEFDFRMRKFFQKKINQLKQMADRAVTLAEELTVLYGEYQNFNSLQVSEVLIEKCLFLKERALLAKVQSRMWIDQNEKFEAEINKLILTKNIDRLQVLFKYPRETAILEAKLNGGIIHNTQPYWLVLANSFVAIESFMVGLLQDLNQSSNLSSRI